MRNAFIPIILFIAAILINGCSDQFLNEKGPVVVEMSSDTIFLVAKPQIDSIVQLVCTSGVNANFEVFQYPKFMVPKSMSGKFVQGSATMEFTTSSNIISFCETNQFNGQLILNVKDYGLVAYPVMIKNYKDPKKLEFSSVAINMGEADSVVLQITNNTASYAAWSMYGLPDWLSAQKTNGILQIGESVNLLFKVNRNYQPAGKYSATITFDINGPISYKQEIPFSMDVINILDDPGKYNIKRIEGIVVAAHYLKSKNQLLVLTNSPGRLTTINFDDNSQTAIEFTKNPFTMAVSENGQEVLVAYTVAVMAHIDLMAHKVIKEYELPFIPFDVEFGENGWCYVSSKTEYTGSNIASINLASGTIFRKVNYYSIPEKVLLKKIPHQEKLLGIPTFHNPSRPRIADISSDSLTTEFYEFTPFDTYYDMWFIKDGAYGISRSKQIYKFNFELAVENQLLLYGSINGNNFKDINFVSEDSLNQRVAICYFDYTNDYKSSYVSIFESEGFNETAVIYPTPVPDKGQLVSSAFFNQKGDKLFMIIRAKERYIEDEGEWYIETKELK
jgi:hypothetical protein